MTLELALSYVVRLEVDPGKGHSGRCWQVHIPEPTVEAMEATVIQLQYWALTKYPEFKVSDLKWSGWMTGELRGP